MGTMGVIDAMRKSYEQNRNLLEKRKSLKDISNETSFKSHKKYLYKKSTPERLARLRMQLLDEKRKSTLKLIFTFVLLLTIFGALSYWLLF